MTLTDILGFTAASLTTLAFIPQALTCVRTNRTDGLSLPMYALFSTGVALWLCYGLATEAWPVAISNAATLSFALVILGMLIRDALRKRRGGTERTSARDRVRAVVVGE